MIHPTHRIDPKLDLVLERVVDVAPELVWAAWTQPEHLLHWFTPAPWKTVDCEVDLRPGGIFRTVMRSPEGQEFPGSGCYLEVIPNERLVWTNVLAPGFRPAGPPSADEAECAHFAFTAVIALAPHGKGTKYTALVMHSAEEGRKKHEEMGFHEGWGKALDQLVEHMRR
ncbi:MAG: SRPBCC family protein [Burkholderiales bacterium]|nr:SRPBCC family protein [Burkholderiales bacterium]